AGGSRTGEHTCSKASYYWADAAHSPKRPRARDRKVAFWAVETPVAAAVAPSLGRPLIASVAQLGSCAQHRRPIAQRCRSRIWAERPHGSCAHVDYGNALAAAQAS